MPPTDPREDIITLPSDTGEDVVAPPPDSGKEVDAPIPMDHGVLWETQSSSTIWKCSSEVHSGTNMTIMQMVIA